MKAEKKQDSTKKERPMTTFLENIFMKERPMTTFLGNISERAPDDIPREHFLKSSDSATGAAASEVTPTLNVSSTQD